MNFSSEIRGKIRYDYPLSNTTWFGVGGKAKYFFKPEDEEDLAFFLKLLPKEIPYICLGVCSNLIIRDGGFEGVVIKLGRNFSKIEIKDKFLIAGGSALDVNVAKFTAENSIMGLEFLIGIPGTIGGAIAMNAGAYGSEIKDVLVKVDAVDKSGNLLTFTNDELGFKYRSNSLPKDIIFTKAYFKVEKGDAVQIRQKMEEISHSREKTQPVREKTGGSTFKNPKGSNKKAWELVEDAGCRGMVLGGAKVSEKHCNFLINDANGSAADLENLGEKVIEMVRKNSGINLQWEIKRIGNK